MIPLTNVHCLNCEYYDGGSIGNNSLEGYEPAQEPMCCQPNVLEIADKDEDLGIVITGMMFFMSALGNCPFKRIKRPQSIADRARGRAAYRSRDK